MSKEGIVIDRIRYMDVPDKVSTTAMLKYNRARDVSGENTSLMAARQSAGDISPRFLTNRQWLLGWDDGMVDDYMFDHLRMLYANQRIFVFQYDAMYSRNVAACQFVDPECTKWATPTYPIVPYNHDAESAYDWTGCLLINNIRYTGTFDVDEDNGIVILPEGVADVNTRVQLRYDFRTMARVSAFEQTGEPVIGSVRTVSVVLNEIGPAVYNCGPFTTEERTC